MDYMAIIGMIGQLAGQAAGRAAAQIPEAELMKLLQGSIDDLGKINVPQLQKLVLEKQGNTGLANIHDDPAYRAQQAAADAQLNQVIESGGLTISDMAALNRIRAKTAQDEAAGRGQITNEMAARGSLDSGNQLAMQLANQQNAAQRENAFGEQTAGAAQARAYQAIQDRARQAGQGLDRSYNQQANAARAQDAINAGNTAIANTAARYNAGLGQQDFQNQITLAGAKQGPARTMADVYNAQATDAQNRGNQQGNMFAAGMNALGSMNKGGGKEDTGTGLTPPPMVQSEPTSSEFSSYPGGSSELNSTGQTRSTLHKVLTGYDSNGVPMYTYEP